jgi:hypothetical protein
MTFLQFLWFNLCSSNTMADQSTLILSSSVWIKLKKKVGEKKYSNHGQLFLPCQADSDAKGLYKKTF